MIHIKTRDPRTEILVWSEIFDFLDLVRKIIKKSDFLSGSVQFDKKQEPTRIIPIRNSFCSPTFATADINRIFRLFTTVNSKLVFRIQESFQIKGCRGEFLILILDETFGNPPRRRLCFSSRS